VAVETLPLDAATSFSWRGLRLLGRGPLPDSLHPGDRLDVDLYWQAEAAPLPVLRAELALQPDAAAGERAGSLTLDAAIGGAYPTGEWVAGETVRDRQGWRLDPALPTGSYHLLLRLHADNEASAPVELGSIVVSGRAHNFEVRAAMAHTAGATFSELAQLLGYDGPQVAEREMALTLYWRALASSETPHTVSVQLLDGNGVLVAQRDRPPGDGAYPTTSWVRDEVLTDAYRVDLPDDLAAGTYTVIVKLYDATTLAPLPVVLPDGSRAGEFLRLAEVRIGD
jgi:hypothetical protein